MPCTVSSVIKFIPVSAERLRIISFMSVSKNILVRSFSGFFPRTTSSGSGGLSSGTNSSFTGLPFSLIASSVFFR
ncbi:MAG: hypothetical protein COS27_10560 [Nitrospirae bacterium CG02_land_8_20_14_3_00_41_53]|nr:MAG: hypothetical protein COS27_10560 [Nitrospirae bacterium CG02_land_8_20_14_3_00_41_53]